MSASTALITKIRNGQYDCAFSLLYGKENLEIQRARYIQAVEGFVEVFGDEGGELQLFSAPGRTEIGGNHTDHNHGRVLAGSVNLDVIAVVRPADGVIRVKSEGYPMDTVAIDSLAVCDEEKNRSASLIRGTAARFNELDYTIGGWASSSIIFTTAAV